MKPIQSPVFLLSYLYFLQGLPYGLQARFLPIYFRANGMSLSNIGFIKVLFFPWMCKTLWAPLVDHHGNKKVWLLGSMFGLALTCFLAASIEPDWLFSVGAVLLILNLLTSTQDIATDGLAIEILTSSQVASGNIAQVVGYKFGAIIGGGLLAWLSDYLTWGAIFIFLASIYVTAVGFVNWFVPEDNSVNLMTMNVDVPEPSKSNSSHDAESETQSQRSEKSMQVNDGILTAKQVSFDSGDSINNYQYDAPNDTPVLSELDRKTDHSTNFVEDLCVQTSSSGFGANQEPGQEGGDQKNCTDQSWIREHFATMFRSPGTSWILAYVLVYKLGEQGALSMMPMFLIDRGISTAHVGLWTGVVGQAVSISGSIFGGAVVSSDRFTPFSFLRLLNVFKVVVLALETVAISVWSGDSISRGLGAAPCIILMLALLLLSGAVSTAAFTLMMQCSQRADASCRASHYSLLATAEVVGKLVFSIFVGALTDIVGYTAAFMLFLSLSLMVIPFFWYAPLSIQVGSMCNDKSCDKKC